VKRPIHQLSMYVLASLMSAVVLTQSSAARIIYTPANVTLNGNGTITIPQNGGAAEFTIQEVDRSGRCGGVEGYYDAKVTVTPATGNGVVAYEEDAAALSMGAQIGPGSNFYEAQALMANEQIDNGPPPCYEHLYSGYWCDGNNSSPCSSVDAYLGLEVEFKGNTYYGWAHVIMSPTHFAFSVQLKGYAYETTPGQPINAGQTAANEIP
jgi:hypothetical protein